MFRPFALIAVILLAGAMPSVTHGYTLETAGGDTRGIHLRVGDRASQDIGRNYVDGYGDLFFIWYECNLPIFGWNNCMGGSPTAGRHGTRNTVSVDVPANQMGNGTPIAMSANSSGAHLASSYNGAPLCQPGEVYIGGFARKITGGGNGTARLTVQAEPFLQSGSNTIPIQEISWTTRGQFNAGTLSPSSITLGTIPNNNWLEDCLSFTFANSEVRQAGTYRARATFTLSHP